MRILITVVVLFLARITFAQSTGESDPHRGVYIDKFFKTSLQNSSMFDPEFSIISVDVNHDGVFEKEDSILRYAAENHITYLAIFDLHRIFGRHFMAWDENLRRNVDMEEHVVRFMKKAKSQYGITQLGAIGGSENYFDSLKTFLIRHPDADFDAVNIEFEFWTDCVNEFSNYVSILDSMYSFKEEYNLAHPDNPIFTEAYLAGLGWCNSSFGTTNVVRTIDGCTNCSPCATCANPQPRKNDRILYAWFVVYPNSMAIAEQNWFEDSLTGDSTDFHPILYSESISTGGTVDWTGAWFPVSNANNIFTAEEEYYNHWYNDPNVAHGTARQNNVQPGGVQWFATTNMVGHLEDPQILQNTGPYCTSSGQLVNFKYLGPIENGIMYDFWITRDADAATVYPAAGGRITNISKAYQPSTPSTSSVKNIDFTDTLIFPPCILPQGDYSAHLILKYDSAHGKIFQCDNRVIINPGPRILVNGRTEFCEGDYTYLKTTDGGSVTWYRNGIIIPGNSADLEVTADGDYFANITSGNCQGYSDTVHIRVNPAPNISVNAVCNGNGTATLKTNMLPVNFLSSNSGGLAGALYKWNTGETTSEITVTPTGTNTVYRVNVTNPYSGCQRTSQLSLKTPLSAYPATITINQQPSSSCASDGVLTATLHGTGAPQNFYWSTGATTQSISGLSYGTYIIAMNEWASGCTSYDTVTIGTPPVSPVLNTNIQPASCLNSHDGSISITISGGNQPFIYEWNNFPDDSIHDPLALSQNNLFSGYYELLITDANGCRFNEAFELTSVNQKSPIQSVTATAVTGCATNSNGSASITMSAAGHAPYTYAWNDSLHQNTSVAINLKAGSVHVAVTDNNGCVSDTMIGIPSSIEPIRIELADSSDMRTSCYGASDANVYFKILGGASPYSISQPWTLQGNFAKLLNAAAGFHAFTITDNTGCVFTDSVFISQPDSLELFVNSMSASCIGCNDGYFQLSSSGGTGPFNVQWSPVTGTLSGNTIIGLHGGIYSVCITDQNACAVCLTDTISVNPQNIFSVTKNDLVKIYPNPFSKETRLTNSLNALIRFIIYDMSGKVFLQDETESNSYIISRRNFSAGIYILKVFLNDELISVKKLVVD
jgi:hypothetical protein